MNAIWKFPLAASEVVRMPKGAKVLHVHEQGGDAFAWALVDPKAEVVGRRLRIYGTGHPVASEPGAYVGTFHLNGGALIFHVFDEGELP